MDFKPCKNEFCEFLTRFMNTVESELNDPESWDFVPKPKKHTKNRHSFLMKHKLSKWRTVFSIDPNLDIDIEEDIGDFDDELLTSLHYELRPTTEDAKRVANKLKKALGDAEFSAERRLVLTYLSSALETLGFKYDFGKGNRALEIQVQKDVIITVEADEGDVSVYGDGKPRYFKLADPNVHFQIAQEALNQMASAKAFHALKTAFKADVDYEAIAKLLKPQLSPAMRSHLSRIFNQIHDLREKHAEIVQSEAQDAALNSTT